MQFAVLEQIRENCTELSHQTSELKQEMRPVQKTCNEIVEMSKKNLRSRVVKRGIISEKQRREDEKKEEERKVQKRKLDPLNPSKWKNEDGSKIREEKRAKVLQTKQDLLIMIDALCKKNSEDALSKLVRY